jgi:formate hydrogenlyase subunit 4
MLYAVLLSLHVLTLLVFPPLLLGLINRVKAMFGGRQGPPLLQPYIELWRLINKGTVQSTATTWLFRAGPVVAWVTTFLAALIVPLGSSLRVTDDPAASSFAPLSFTGDLILFAYLLALGRFFLVLSSLDTGSPFEGMGVAREITFACLAEPALFFSLLVLAKMTGWLQMAGLMQGPHTITETLGAAPVLLVFASWFLLLLAENCRIPFDDPNTHLELTMIHEVIILDHSGPMLALLHWAAALKMFLFAGLLVRLVLPLELLNPWLQWPAFLAGVLVIAAGVGVVESVMARLRMPLVPHVLTVAGVLSAFGFILLVTMS